MTDVLTPPARSSQPLASEQEAREVAEAAREKEWQAPSFVRELFEGSFRLDLVHPFPAPDPADLERARPFMERLERFLRERVDSDRIDREGKIPRGGDPGAARHRGVRHQDPDGVRRPRAESVQLHPRHRARSPARTATSPPCSPRRSRSACPRRSSCSARRSRRRSICPGWPAGAVSAFALTETQVGRDPAGLDHRRPRCRKTAPTTS